jgi:hypothetical protein
MKIKPNWGGKIATTLPQEQWIQRTINYDPHPTVPWAHWGPQPLTKGQKTLWVVLMIAAVALAIFGEVTK